MTQLIGETTMSALAQFFTLVPRATPSTKTQQQLHKEHSKPQPFVPLNDGRL